MKFQKVTQRVIDNVLAFIQPFASKKLAKDIETLLKPCCKPVLKGSEEYTCCDGIATCAQVTVKDESLKNKTVTLLFEFTGNTDDNHTFSTTAEFDENGEWSESIRIWGYVEDGTVQIRVGVIKEDSSVITYSDYITLENIPNCD